MTDEPDIGEAFIAETVRIGLRLRAEHPERVASFWDARRSFVSRVLRGRGLDERAVADIMAAFKLAVSAEVHRRQDAVLSSAKVIPCPAKHRTTTIRWRPNAKVIVFPFHARTELIRNIVRLLNVDGEAERRRRWTHIIESIGPSMFAAGVPIEQIPDELQKFTAAVAREIRRVSLRAAR